MYNTSDSRKLDDQLMSMKLNKEWHLQHPMPKNPTMEERIAWHLEHVKYCNCREMPDSIKEELKKRKIKLHSS